MAHRLDSILLFVVAPLLLLCSSFAAAATKQKSFCENCQFNVPPDNETECSVYGALTTDNSNSNTLIPWNRASETCLEAMNISMAAVGMYGTVLAHNIHSCKTSHNESE